MASPSKYNPYVLFCSGSSMWKQLLDIYIRKLQCVSSHYRRAVFRWQYLDSMAECINFSCRQFYVLRRNRPAPLPSANGQDGPRKRCRFWHSLHLPTMTPPHFFIPLRNLLQSTRNPFARVILFDAQQGGNFLIGHEFIISQQQWYPVNFHPTR